MSVHRKTIISGVTLLAAFAFGGAASAQDQPAQSPPAQTQQPEAPPATPPSEPAAAAPTPAPSTAPTPAAPPPSALAPSRSPTLGPAPANLPTLPGAESLPQINVNAPVHKPVTRSTRAVQVLPPSGGTPPLSGEARLTAQSDKFDQVRSNIFTTIGTTSSTISQQAIQAMPQGANQPIERVLLQAPGVSQDAAASGLFHIRNDHANAQFRINGIMLPDGVTGFSSFLDTALVGNLTLVTGALPAEYGLRTTGLIDITTRGDIFNNSGSISYYGGSRNTIEPSFEYGGTFGANCPAAKSASSSSTCFGGVQYFFSGRYLANSEGIENPLPSLNAIHDFTQQEKGFAYLSTFVDPYTRLSLIAGTSTANFQIPNTPGVPPLLTSAFGVTNFDSSKLNESQYEDTQFSVLALQRSTNGFDGQLSYFTRYDNLHFKPDPTGDLLINGIASDISRQSYTNGLQGDASYMLTPAHTLRAGFSVSAEQIWVDNTSLVESTAAPGFAAGNEPPFAVTDDVSKVGWLAGVYIQDEWKITDKLTMNAGLRFDQMWQFVDANQLSPRLSFTYKPVENTTFHAGYSRYFTPPVLVEAAPANIGLFNGTTGATASGGTNPVLPERSHYFDAGVDQKIPLRCYTVGEKDCPSIELGLDAYYKIATDLIDNGQFGQALALSAFNYAHGVVEGVEFSVKYHDRAFQAYGNLAVSQEKATQVVSNQFLFDNVTPQADLGGLTEFQYIQSHWIYTDHNQFVTGSAGLAYKFCDRESTPGEHWWDTMCGTRFSADMFYGSGLRTGDANIGTQPAYAQFNAGIAHEFGQPDGKPLTIRFDVVNLFDTIYQIRSGSGIGVFSSQYGPRRGYFIGISKKI
ncbi:MAG TPA: TonB-dependent receptor [Xanthobacteraceae bacterium]|nr:TonB-dependent receptor [Xanthobacteraceae bacterium]